MCFVRRRGGLICQIFAYPSGYYFCCLLLSCILCVFPVVFSVVWLDGLGFDGAVLGVKNAGESKSVLLVVLFFSSSRSCADGHFSLVALLISDFPFGDTVASVGVVLSSFSSWLCVPGPSRLCSRVASALLTSMSGCCAAFGVDSIVTCVSSMPWCCSAGRVAFFMAWWILHILHLVQSVVDSNMTIDAIVTIEFA